MVVPATIALEQEAHTTSAEKPPANESNHTVMLRISQSKRFNLIPPIKQKHPPIYYLTCGQ